MTVNESQLPKKRIKCSTVNTLKSTSRLSWNRRVTVCLEDSGRYMAKACVELCHQCLCTGGFGEKSQ